jgi:hypothetical protein
MYKFINLYIYKFMYFTSLLGTREEKTQLIKMADFLFPGSLTLLQ